MKIFTPLQGAGGKKKRLAQKASLISSIKNSKDV
jgi:hypothetical protein